MTEAELIRLLLDVADSAVEFQDSRLRWLTVQIDVDTWNAVQELSDRIRASR
jgi:hypothetical protein